MNIKTLADIAKRIPMEEQEAYQEPLKARTRLYSTMSDYLDASMSYVALADDEARRNYAMKAGQFIIDLLLDAQAHLTHEKFTYLLNHSIYDSAKEYPESARNLQHAIEYVWGSEDMFMYRLSGGLPASYVKALTGLKSQARLVGYTLPQIMKTYYGGK